MEEIYILLNKIKEKVRLTKVQRLKVQFNFI